MWLRPNRNLAPRKCNQQRYTQWRQGRRAVCRHGRVRIPGTSGSSFRRGPCAAGPDTSALPAAHKEPTLAAGDGARLLAFAACRRRRWPGRAAARRRRAALGRRWLAWLGSGSGSGS
eukprot:scaffold87870_cov60-Phaeocystis_antarctica.AAC.1